MIIITIEQKKKFVVAALARAARSRLHEKITPLQFPIERVDLMKNGKPRITIMKPALLALAILLTLTNFASAQAVRIFDRLSKQLDVRITNPQDGQRLSYDATAGKWINADGDAVPSLPDPAGHSGEFLTNNGATPNWARVSAFYDQTVGANGFTFDNEHFYFLNVGHEWSIDASNPSAFRASIYAQSAIDFASSKTIYVGKGAAATDTRTGLSPYDYTKPFATIAAAAAAAASGDVIRLGPGSYTPASSPLTMPAGVSLIGSGLDVTTINVNKLIGGLGNTNFSNFTLIGSNGIGGTASGSVLTVTNVRSDGTNDCVTPLGGSGSGTIRFFNCLLTGSYDAINIAGSNSGWLVEGYNSNIILTGPGTTGITRGIACNIGKVRWFDGSITVTGNANTVETVGIESSGGAVEIYNCVLTVNAGTGNTGVVYDLNNSSGTIGYANVTRPDGAALVTNGSVSRLSRFAIRDNNLSDLASPSTSLDNIGGEHVANKVTSFSTPTDGQYPSAKLVSDQLATKATSAQGTKADNAGAVTGLIKSNGSASFSAAVAGTDYVSPGGAAGTPSSITLTNATGLPTAGLLDGAVTLAKMADITGPVILGRTTADGTGPPKALTLGTGVLMAASSTPDATGGLLTYGLIGTSGTKIPLLSTANTFTAGQKQTFGADATNAGIRAAGVSADPSSLAAGDLWYRSDTEEWKYRGTSVTRTLMNLAGAQSPTNKTFDSTSNVALKGANTDITSLALTAASTLTLAPAANTAVTGLLLTNVTAATSGNQQYSPVVRWTGQGWKTGGGGASQVVDFRAYVIPVQSGGTTPHYAWVIDSAVNGGAFGRMLWLSEVNTATSANASNGAVLSIGTSDNGGVACAYLGGDGTSANATAFLSATVLRVQSGGLLQWNSQANQSSGGADVGLARNGIGVVEINSGTAGTFRDLKLRNGTLSGTLDLTGVLTMSAVPKFAGTNTTGSGTAALGLNSPATTNAAPYTWVQITTADGSTAYIPAWK